MRKVFFTTILLITGFYAGVAQNNAECDIHSLSDSCKRTIKPFIYSSQSALHVALKSEPQVKAVNFPTFEGEKYRIIINTLSMPKGTEVDIYDQDATHKKRKQLFSTKTNGVSNFDTECKSNRIFVEYNIPAASATCFSGCAVIVVGYETSLGK